MELRTTQELSWTSLLTRVVTAAVLAVIGLLWCDYCLMITHNAELPRFARSRVGPLVLNAYWATLAFALTWWSWSFVHRQTGFQRIRIAVSLATVHFALIMLSVRFFRLIEGRF